MNSSQQKRFWLGFGSAFGLYVLIDLVGSVFPQIFHLLDLPLTPLGVPLLFVMPELLLVLYFALRKKWIEIVGAVIAIPVLIMFFVFLLYVACYFGSCV